MIYYCRDCSYKGTQRSAEGFCPACGSARFRARGANAKPEKPEKGNGRLVLVILLWAYLIAHVTWKLIN